MKKSKARIALLSVLVISASLGWGNGLNLNSLGTKALTMGGAFVGLADDFSAMYWNPAGATRFKSKYFGFYAVDLMPTSRYKLSALGTTLVDAKTATKHYFGGMAAYYYPVSDKLVLGLGAYTPSGLGANWIGGDFVLVSAGKAYELSSRIGLVSISPLIAYKINDIVSVGATLNINHGMFAIKMHSGEFDVPGVGKTDLGQYDESMNGWGFGATAGLLVRPNEKLSLGLTVRTASRIKLEGEATISNLALLKLNDISELARNLTWPMWIAGGVSFKPTAKLTLTGDVQWTQWSKVDKLETVYTDAYWKSMLGAAGMDTRVLDWSSKVQVRLGAEYILSDAFVVRGGYYIDPSPSPDTTMNILLPSYDFNVVTLGLGHSIHGLQLDFGLEYLMGKERNVDYMKSLSDPAYKHAQPGNYKMKIFVPNLSIGYKF